MSTPSGKRMLVVIRQPPYGSSLGRSGLDTALATAAFDQPVDLLFLGDGVLNLQPGQDSAVLGLKLGCDVAVALAEPLTGDVLLGLQTKELGKVVLARALVEGVGVLLDGDAL